MQDPVSIQPGGFDMVAAALRADTTDLHSFLDLLAGQLTDALPGHVRVQRESGLFKKDPRVTGIQVTLSPSIYDLRWNRDALEARIDGGLVALDQWNEALWRNLRQQAAASSDGRAALSQLVAGQAPAQNISRLPAGRGRLLWRRPDPEIPSGSRLTVEQGEAAVFTDGGNVLGVLASGSHLIDPLEQQFLSSQLDSSTGLMRCTLDFVTVRELPGQPFGGMVDNVADPETGLAIGLRVFGDYSLQVSDPGVFAVRLGDQAAEGDERITDWMRDQLLKVLRTDVVAHIGDAGWPILGIAAHTPEIEAETVESVRKAVAGYGLTVLQMGNFTISMKEEDEANLKQYRTALQLKRLNGDGPAGPSGPAAGAAPPPAAAPPAAAACAACGAGNAPGARFCSSCGSPLAAVCPACSTSNPGGSRFCGNCGKSLA